MTFRTRLLLLPAVILLIAAVPDAPAPALLDEADAAFARGDFSLAAELYTKADLRAPDPGRVALGLAAAKYRLALESPGRPGVILAEAEDLYRYCLAETDPRRGAALVGLGNCLLRDAGSRDAAAAWSAAERFKEAENAAANDELQTMARHNLQRARLLARQIPTGAQDKQDKPPQSEDPEKDRKPPENGSQPQEGGDDRANRRYGAQQEAADAGQPSTSSDESRLPGEGKLPPVPDQDGQPPLTPPQAREHLEQAAQRIMQEARVHRRGVSRTPAAGVRDW
jgi:type II secretory pathway pseudopilin PulG